MAADKVRFLFKSVLDDATVSASTETSGLPAGNVKTTLIRQLYRTTGKVSEFIRFKASGAATGANCVFIGNHNFTKNAVVTWSGHTSSNFTGCTLNTTISVATDAQGNVVPVLAVFYSSVQTYLHWRLKVKDSGNASSTLEVGRVMVGRYVEPTRNLRDGFTIRTIDPSRILRTAGREGYANTRKQYKEFSYSSHDLDESEQDLFLGIYAQVGSHKSLVFALDPSSRPHHNTIYCQFTGPVERSHRMNRNMSLNDITFSEKN